MDINHINNLKSDSDELYQNIKDYLENIDSLDISDIPEIMEVINLRLESLVNKFIVVSSDL